VFGHMHHALRRGQGMRRTIGSDREGTLYLNAACVPRHGQDAAGRELRHFSWVELGRHGDGPVQVLRACHRWYGLCGQLLYEECLHEAVPC